MLRSIPPAIVIMLFSTPVHAEQWWSFHVDKINAKLIELDSLSRSPKTGTVNVWTAVIYSSAVSFIPEGDAYVARSLIRVDCANNRYRPLQSEYLTKDLARRGVYDLSEQPWTYAEPGTSGSSLIQSACKEFAKSDGSGPIPSLYEASLLYNRWLKNTPTSDS